MLLAPGSLLCECCNLVRDFRADNGFWILIIHLDECVSPLQLDQFFACKATTLFTCKQTFFTVKKHSLPVEQPQEHDERNQEESKRIWLRDPGHDRAPIKIGPKLIDTSTAGTL